MGKFNRIVYEYYQSSIMPAMCYEYSLNRHHIVIIKIVIKIYFIFAYDFEYSMDIWRL